MVPKGLEGHRWLLQRGSENIRETEGGGCLIDWSEVKIDSSKENKQHENVQIFLEAVLFVLQIEKIFCCERT